MSRNRSHAVRLGVVAVAILLLATGLATPVAAAHGAPVVTSPLDGTTACVPPGETDATVAVEGTAIADAPVTVRHGGAPLANGTADGAGAFSVPTDLAAGVHVLDVVATDPAEPAHDSDPSAPVTVTVVDPNGALGAVSRTSGVISPRNGDGYLDRVTYSVPVAQDGMVGFQVKQGATLVRQSPAVEVTAGGSATWTWKGTTPTGAWASTGTYQVYALWEGNGCTTSAKTSLKIDNFAPGAAGTAQSLATVFPAENDAYLEYKDTVTLEYSGLTETAHVSVYVFRRGGTVPVRRISIGWRDAGSSGTYVWNGRGPSGAMMPEGSYDVAWRFVDGARNERLVGRRGLNISHHHVVKQTTTLQVRGDAFVMFAESGCGDVSTAASDWAEGVWLVTEDCYWDDQVPDAALVEYSISVPNAIVHAWAKLGVHGYSVTRTPLYGAVIDNGDNIHPISGSFLATSPDTRWLSTFSLKDRVSSSRRVVVDLLSFSTCDCDRFTDYDIRWVYLQVGYGALVPQ